MRHRRDPEPEPELGPTREDIENGAEPADALYIDRGWLPDAPEPPDPLAAGYAAIQVWRAEQRAHAEAERQADAEIAADVAAENAHAIEAEGAREAEYDREPEIG